jgi:hypothetical protein
MKKRVCLTSERRILKLKHDAVSNPEHYTAGRQHEPLDVVEDWCLDYHLGNVVKYISRAGRKDSMVQDLEKAMFYLTRKINIEKESEKGGNKNG